MRQTEGSAEQREGSSGVFAICTCPFGTRQMIDTAHGVDIDGLAATINEATYAGRNRGAACAPPTEQWRRRAAQVHFEALQPCLRVGCELVRFDLAAVSDPWLCCWGADRAGESCCSAPWECCGDGGQGSTSVSEPAQCDCLPRLFACCGHDALHYCALCYGRCDR